MKFNIDEIQTFHQRVVFPVSQAPGVWMEALSPDGYTYYYNTETGGQTRSYPHYISFQMDFYSNVFHLLTFYHPLPLSLSLQYTHTHSESSWERPAGLPAEGSGSRGEPEGQGEETGSRPGTLPGGEESSRPGTLPGGEESSRPAEAGDSTQASIKVSFRLSPLSLWFETPARG